MTHAWTVINVGLGMPPNEVHVRHRDDGLVVCTVEQVEGLYSVQYTDGQQSHYISLETARVAVENNYP